MVAGDSLGVPICWDVLVLEISLQGKMFTFFTLAPCNQLDGRRWEVEGNNYDKGKQNYVGISGGSECKRMKGHPKRMYAFAMAI